MTVRASDDADWPRILELADISVPFDLAGNREWLTHRQDFDNREWRRVQYVSPTSGQVDGFASAEGGPESGHFRLFAVMSDAELELPIAPRLMKVLFEDLAAMEARLVWTREDGRQLAIYRFFKNLGLRESRRFTWEDRKIVVMHMDLDPQMPSDR